jgi:hypothetical protein
MLQEHVTWFGEVLTLPIVVAIDGDYNTDGVVNVTDYTVWRDTRGQSGIGLAADGNADGQIDRADYNMWALHFGDSNIAGTDQSNVPEPTSILLLTLAMTCSGCWAQTRSAGLAYSVPPSR